jgi:hypothetical protein
MGTLADMSAMARKIALARKAIGEIRRIEDYLLANKYSVSQADANSGWKETIDYCVIVADSVNEAIAILKDVKGKIEKYQEEIHDATN